MYPDVDRFREQPDSEPNQAIVPLEDARFIDRLEPENETLWQELIKKAREADMSLDDFAIPIWMDETFPRAIRDRALLLMIGNANSKLITGGWSGGMGMGFAFYGFSIYSIKNQYPEFDFEKFKQWLEEAKNYESKNSKIINDKVSWRQTYAYFDLGIYNQEQFEKALEEFDWLEVSPKSGGTGWYGDSYSLDPERFPYLDDIFRGETTNSPAIKQWARTKLVEFINTDEKDIETLPVWMRYQDEEQVMKILRPIYIEWVAGRQEFDDILLPAFERYGWKDLVNKSMCYSDSLKLIEHLPDHLKISLISWTLSSYSRGESHLEMKSIETLKNHITELGANHLLPLVDICAAKTKAYDEKIAHQNAKRKEESRIRLESDPKEIAKREARERYQGLLNSIRLSVQMDEEE